MAPPRIRKETYEAMLALHREGVPTISELAKRAGVNRRTAMKALDFGWPEQGWLSLRDAIAQERAEARVAAAKVVAEQAAAAADTREQARSLAVKSLSEEARMLGLARGDIGAILGLAAELLPPMRTIVQGMSKAINEKMANGMIDPELGMKLLSRYAAIIRHGTDAAALVVDTERKRLGDPNATLGISIIDDMSPEDALAELERVKDTLDRANELGLTVLEGGLGKDEGANGNGAASA